MAEHSASFVHDVGLVLAVAAITGLLFRLLRRPSILGYLLTGVLVGPYLPLPLFADPSRVHALSEFGVVLVMFAVGLEFRIKKLLQILPVAGVAGLVQMATMVWVGISIGRLFEWSQTEALFLGASIAISSTMVVSKVLADVHLSARLREFVFGILVLQDVAAIVLITIMTAVAKGTGLALPAIAWTVTKLVGILLALGAAGLLTIPRLTRKVIALGSRETLVVYACGVCFGLALLAEKLGYSVALGAFLAGILFSESGRGELVGHRVEPVRDIFAAIFFVSIGMTVDPSLALQNLPLALTVFAGVIFGQLISVTIGGVLSGVGLERSIAAGFTLGQIGEFSFIISAVGVSASVVRPEIQPILVTASVLGALSTPTAVRISKPVVDAIQARLPGRVERALVLYESWFLRLRSPENAVAGVRLRRLIISVFIDIGGVVAATFAWSRVSRPLQDFVVYDVGLHRVVGSIGSASVLFLCTAPFFIALLRNTRRIAHEAVYMVFRASEAPKAAERFLRTGLTVIVTLVAGVMVAAALRSFLSNAIVLPVVAIAVVWGLARLWSTTTQLDKEIKSGVRELLDLIEHQATAITGNLSLGMYEVAHESGDLPTRENELGLPNMANVQLEANSFAVGKTLAEIGLRAETGASVIAIQRTPGDVLVPTGNEALRARDILLITGDAEAATRAEVYLRRGPSPSTP
ncbi:MAG: cation:proton antiporter [Deltaproteobacteria bacterium]|nr:cation:proton antiporter [Deltaproteobacteria bacterium]